MPGIEDLTLYYKIAKLAFDTFTTIRSATGAWWQKADFRIISSLTTMEFEQEGSDQVCHCVQDRAILILRDKTLLPPFRYGSVGTDFIDGLIVNDSHVKLREERSVGGLRSVTPDEPVGYSKGEVVRAVLIARSVNGYTQKEEYLDSDVSEWIDKATLVMIFPKTKKPSDVQVLGKAPNTSVWVPEKRQSYEIRTTTKERPALVRESLNPKFGMKHKVRWTW